MPSLIANAWPYAKFWTLCSVQLLKVTCNWGMRRLFR